MRDLQRLVEAYKELAGQVTPVNDPHVDSGLRFLVAAAYLGEKLDDIAASLARLNDAKELPNT